MSTVHRVKKKEYKNFLKNLLVCDLIYGMFVLHYI